MHIAELIQYLIWPAFIAIAWFIIKGALAYYERKFPQENQPAETDGQKNAEINETRR